MTTGGAFNGGSSTDGIAETGGSFGGSVAGGTSADELVEPGGAFSSSHESLLQIFEEEVLARIIFPQDTGIELVDGLPTLRRGGDILQEGDVYIDSSNRRIYYYISGVWEEATSVGTVGFYQVVQNTLPTTRADNTALIAGDLAFVRSTDMFYIYSGSAYEPFITTTAVEDFVNTSSIEFTEQEISGVLKVTAAVIVSAATGNALSLTPAGLFVDISGKQDLIPIGSLTTQVVAWNGTSYSPRSLEIADILGLQSAIQGKQNALATGSTSSDVIAWNGTSYAPRQLSSADISGLNDALANLMTLIEAKQDALTDGTDTNQALFWDGSDYMPRRTTIADVDGLQSALSGAHGSITDGTAITQALYWDGTEYSPRMGELTDIQGLPSALDGKQDDITNVANTPQTIKDQIAGAVGDGLGAPLPNFVSLSIPTANTLRINFTSNPFPSDVPSEAIEVDISGESYRVFLDADEGSVGGTSGYIYDIAYTRFSPNIPNTVTTITFGHAHYADRFRGQGPVQKFSTGDGTDRVVSFDLDDTYDPDTWNSKQDALTFDETPQPDSTNPVESRGLHSELATKQDNITNVADTPQTIKDQIAASSGGSHPAIPAGDSNEDALFWDVDAEEYLPKTITINDVTNLQTTLDTKDSIVNVDAKDAATLVSARAYTDEQSPKVVGFTYPANTADPGMPTDIASRAFVISEAQDIVNTAQFGGEPVQLFGQFANFAAADTSRAGLGDVTYSAATETFTGITLGNAPGSWHVQGIEGDNFTLIGLAEDNITPIRFSVISAGAQGPTGSPGMDGTSITVTDIPNGALLSDGTTTATVNDGTDGTSITVTDVPTGAALSDGTTTVIVTDGTDGMDGPEGRYAISLYQQVPDGTALSTPPNATYDGTNFGNLGDWVVAFPGITSGMETYRSFTEYSTASGTIGTWGSPFEVSAEGATGPAGPTGPVSAFSGTGVATPLTNTQAPTVTLTGAGTVDDNYVLNLGIPAGPQGLKGDLITTISSLPPVSPSVGDIWIDSDDGVETTWTGTQWFQTGGPGIIAQAQESIDVLELTNNWTIQAVAEGLVFLNNNAALMLVETDGDTQIAGDAGGTETIAYTPPGDNGILTLTEGWQIASATEGLTFVRNNIPQAQLQPDGDYLSIGSVGGNFGTITYTLPS